MNRALLFINGVPPEQLPETASYDIVACSDGAFHYLKEKGFALDLLYFISGDFDSHTGSDEEIYSQRFIYTPDQDKTDFQKSLEILLERGIQKVDVYGGSGGEFACYFFAEEHTVLNDVKNRMVSLYPYPEAAQITTKGLKWPLSGETLNMTDRIGTRNLALEDSVVINFERGALVLFVGLATGDANGSAEG